VSKSYSTKQKIFPHSPIPLIYLHSFSAGSYYYLEEQKIKTHRKKRSNRKISL